MPQKPIRIRYSEDLTRKRKLAVAKKVGNAFAVVGDPKFGFSPNEKQQINERLGRFQRISLDRMNKRQLSDHLRRFVQNQSRLTSTAIPERGLAKLSRHTIAVDKTLNLRTLENLAENILKESNFGSEMHNFGGIDPYAKLSALICSADVMYGQKAGDRILERMISSKKFSEFGDLHSYLEATTNAFRGRLNEGKIKELLNKRDGGPLEENTKAIAINAAIIGGFDVHKLYSGRIQPYQEFLNSIMQGRIREASKNPILEANSPEAHASSVLLKQSILMEEQLKGMGLEGVSMMQRSIRGLMVMSILEGGSESKRKII
ncbi:MAG: hypothetical protein Q7R70_04330 [Candidatus Diapherotrites archaeon]|nr:hypothetical protein [Candidatus Diapherotrites archaeon]